ncbi:MAG: hypothetical protein ACRCX2_16685 [Paraclostridium sp.]
MEKAMMNLLVKGLKENMVRQDGQETDERELEFVIAMSLNDEEKQMLADTLTKAIETVHKAVLRGFEQHAPHNIINNSEEK